MIARRFRVFTMLFLSTTSFGIAVLAIMIRFFSAFCWILTLGIHLMILLERERKAAQDDIQKAYRRLAKKLHPDLNPGNKEAEERFKEVSLANDILSDEAKRKKFDNGEIDATGAERPRQQYYKDFAAEAAAIGR